MATDDAAPPLAVRQQQLATDLRHLREQAGLSGRELAMRINAAGEIKISQSKVSRIEAGRTVPSVLEVVEWTTAVNAPTEHSSWLRELAESVFAEAHIWRKSLRPHEHHQYNTEECEAAARLVRCYQPSAVPGLLQVAGYARRMFEMAAVPYTIDDLTSAINTRMLRQEVLYEEGRRFEFIITEAALRWRPASTGLSFMVAQLNHISSMSTLDNVSVGIILLNQQALVPISHSFFCYEKEEGDPVGFVEVETIHENIIVRDPEKVALYRERWSKLSQMPIYDDEARRFLNSLSTELRASED